MISARKYVRAAIFFGLFALVTGGLLFQQMPEEAVAQDAAQDDSGSAAVQEAAPDATPATSNAASVECYESIKDATKLPKVDNVVPKYGYPNVKCSPTTGAVLWYGDPYYGTEPMGEMPKFNDKTDGDFAQAVIRPRVEHLKTLIQTNMQCSSCHPGADPATQQNDPRQLMMHQDIIADAQNLQHGRGAIWCFDCHNAANRDTLADQQGNEVSFNESQKVCGSCHGDIYSDWRMGLHGKRTGEWKVGGKNGGGPVQNAIIRILFRNIAFSRLSLNRHQLCPVV